MRGREEFRWRRRATRQTSFKCALKFHEVATSRKPSRRLGTLGGNSAGLGCRWPTVLSRYVPEMHPLWSFSEDCDSVVKSSWLRTNMPPRFGSGHERDEFRLRSVSFYYLISPLKVVQVTDVWPLQFYFADTWRDVMINIGSLLFARRKIATQMETCKFSFSIK